MITCGAPDRQKHVRPSGSHRHMRTGRGNPWEPDSTRMSWQAFCLVLPRSFTGMLCAHWVDAQP
eukprot:9478878-Pyramimonas_sp.AAC.1